MGSVRKRGRGYQLRYYAGGQLIEETIQADNYTEAVTVLKAREGRIAEGRAGVWVGRKLRFDDLCGGLEADYQLKNRRNLKNLSAYTRHLKAYFGARRAAEIAPADVRSYIAKRQAEGAAHGTINRELAALKRMYNLALREEHLYRKPDIPMLPESAPRRGFFEVAQFRGVLAALPAYVQPVALFAYYSGWRLSELTSMTWSQVDTDARQVRLWRGTTKSGEGRLLPLEGQLWEIITRQVETRPAGCPWVFHRRGKRIRSFRKAWGKACSAAGCPGMLFHDLRRTAARNFRRAGLGEHEAMAITGHKTAEVFHRYDIIAEPDIKDAVWRTQGYFASVAPGLELPAAPQTDDSTKEPRKPGASHGHSMVKPSRGEKRLDLQSPAKSVR